jgi:hypothetical protein
MTNSSLTQSGRWLSIGFCSAALLLAVGTAPLALTGCGGGGGSGSSGANLTNAAAPASLPAGLVATNSNGSITFTDGSHYSSTTTVQGFVGTSGTYTYAVNGTTAVLTVTPAGDSPEIHQLSSFTVTNGRYTSVYDVPPSNLSSPFNQPSTLNFSGTTMSYVAPSGTTTTNDPNAPVVGSTYRVIGRSGNAANPDPIGTDYVITVANSTSVTATVSGVGSIQFTKQSNGSYTGVYNGVSTTVTLTSNATSATAVATGTNPNNSAFTETYTLAKQ